MVCTCILDGGLNCRFVDTTIECNWELVDTATPMTVAHSL
jgi:hypothetical protein